MNNFRIVTVDGRMQTVTAEPEIDIVAERIALRQLLRDWALPGSTPKQKPAEDPEPGVMKDAESKLADAIPAAIEHAAACVGPDGVAKFFEGYMPEQAKGAKPVVWMNQYNRRPYWFAGGRVVLKVSEGNVATSSYCGADLRSDYFTPIYPGDPRLAEWGLAEPAAQPVRFDGVDDTLEEFRARQPAAQPVALEGVEYVDADGFIYKLVGRIVSGA